MKNLLPLALLCALLLFNACNDDDEGPTIPLEPDPVFETSSYSLLTPGNYWVYQRYSEDDDGNLVLGNQLDSSYVEKDSLINGETYFKFVEQSFGVISNRYLRDSANFIINEKGELIFALDNNGMLLSSTDDGNVQIDLYMVGTRIVKTNLGEFEAVKKELETIVNGESSLDRCGLNTNWYYVKGIGVVQHDAFYFSTCGRVRKELVRYSVS